MPSEYEREYGRRRSAARRRVEKTCPVCGETFTANIKARTCSTRCRSKRYRQRKAALVP